jgi:hypothetical protein
LMIADLVLLGSWACSSEHVAVRLIVQERCVH